MAKLARVYTIFVTMFGIRPDLCSWLFQSYSEFGDVKMKNNVKNSMKGTFTLKSVQGVLVVRSSRKYFYRGVVRQSAKVLEESGNSNES